jgi:hypothetical protein
MTTERVDEERELAALDTIENLLEYAKKDILRPVFMESLEAFQQELLDYRGLVYDVIHGDDASPADGGVITSAVIDGTVAPVSSDEDSSEV